MSKEPTDLRRVVNAIHADQIKPAFDEYVAALGAVRSANDPDAPSVDMIQACEALQAKFKAAAETLRSSLFASMKETGVTEFERGMFVVSIRAGATSASIKDEKAVRLAAPDLFLPQPDKVDKAALTKRLKAGIEVKGAELSTAAEMLAIRRA